jgi:YjbE family integral membrane protein
MSSVAGEVGAVHEIAWINILLSADNAILVALACRNLRGDQQRLGILFGAGGAIALRIAFTLVVAQLLDVPFLTLVGGLFVIFLATKLPREDSNPPQIEGSRTLLRAVISIVVADVLVSLDNALALAAAAKGSARLIIFGLLLSGPTIMLGAGLLASLMARLPALIWIGAVILGWAGGQLIARDSAFKLLGLTAPPSELWTGALGAAVVVFVAIISKLFGKYRTKPDLPPARE